LSEIGDRLCLTKVETPIEEGSFGEFAGSGCASTGGERRGECSLAKQLPSMAMNFHNIFASWGPIRMHGQEQNVVNGAPIVGRPENRSASPVRSAEAWGDLLASPAEHCGGDFEGFASAQTQNRDRGGAGGRRDCRDRIFGIARHLFFPASVVLRFPEFVNSAIAGQS
jgi:hypothetical protein